MQIFLILMLFFGPFWLNIKLQVPKQKQQTPQQTPQQIAINTDPTNPSQNLNPIQNNPISNISQLEKQAVDSYNSAGLKSGSGN